MADDPDGEQPSARMIAAAAALLSVDGVAAVTTRAVAAAAGVQAPTIYRLFGDKDGLLEAVAEHMMAGRADAKSLEVQRAATAGTDPVDDLRSAWLSQVDFGLANPGVFALLSDPSRVSRSPSARKARAALDARVHRVAAASRLRVGERRAAGLLQSAAIGTIQSLLSTPPESRDPALATAMYAAVTGAILTESRAGATDVGSDGATLAAIALRAAAADLAALTVTERQLLADWLDRIIEDADRPSRS